MSSFFGFSKEKIFKMAVVFNEQQDLESKDDVIKAGLLLVQHIYGHMGTRASRLRFLSYNRMIANKTLNPARLPPTTSAATEYILRAYLQYHNWAMLNT